MWRVTKVITLILRKMTELSSLPHVVPATNGNHTYHSVKVGEYHISSLLDVHKFPDSGGGRSLIPILLAVVTCDEDPPAVLFSAYSKPGNNTYGTVIQYECLEGYRFKRGAFVEYVTCTEAGSWQPAISECESMTWWNRNILLALLLRHEPTRRLINWLLS